MAWKPTTITKPVTGPPQSLVKCIELLHSLFQGIPASLNLPFEPPVSNYYFSLDPDTLEDGGGLAALSRCLEITFETWRNGSSSEIQLTERGQRLENLVVFLKDTLRQHIKSESDWQVFKEAWVEQLIAAAKQAGGKAAPRGQKRKDQGCNTDITPGNNSLPQPPHTPDILSALYSRPAK